MAKRLTQLPIFETIQDDDLVYVVQNGVSGQMSYEDFFGSELSGYLPLTGGDLSGPVEIISSLQSAFIVDTNVLVVDALNNRVGINIAEPTAALDVVGNYILKDAITQNKAIRMRTTGSAVDLEAGGTDLFLSVNSEADFDGGTSNIYFVMGAASHTIKAFGNWEFRTGNVSFSGNLLLSVNGDSVTPTVVFNESANNYDFRMEGDADANLFFLDASSDRIGIGNAAPTEKLDITGNIAVSGTVDGVKVSSLIGLIIALG